MKTSSIPLSTDRPKPFVPASPGLKRSATTRKLEAGVNKKGGVGKTTTAFNVAEYLGLLGYRVLAVDLDSSASLTEATGVDLAQPGYKVDDLGLSRITLM